MPQRPMLLLNSIRKKSRASKASGLWRYGILSIIGAAFDKNTGVKDACKNACCSMLFHFLSGAANERRTG
jgi:hypothetical protein